MLYVTIIDGRTGRSETRTFRGEVLIGSNPSCTIVLNDPDVAPQHLLLEPSSGSGVLAQPRRANALVKFGDGRRMIERTLLSGETQLLVGAYVLEVSVRKDPFEEVTELDDFLDSAEAHLACTQSYHCPKYWSALSPTPDQTRRHCPECKRDVYLVWSEEMYNRYTKLGHCAAVMVGDPGGGFDGERTFIADEPPPNLTPKSGASDTTTQEVVIEEAVEIDPEF